MITRLLVLAMINLPNYLLAQGTGSMTDYNDVFENRNLVSFNFNGKLYAPRHTLLPEKDFQFAAPTGESFKVGCLVRGVQLYVKDGNKPWKLANGNPIFMSVTAGSELEVELSLFSKDIGGDGNMIRIDSEYFVFYTTYRVKVAGQSGNARYPIIFLFKEQHKEGLWSIDWKSFQPTPAFWNEIKSVEAQLKKVTFNMSNGKRVWLTFDPNAEYDVGWEDTDGTFSFHQFSERPHK